MTKKIFDTMRQMLADRYTTVLAAGVLLVIVLFCVYVGFHIQVSEIKVYMHYSAFGVTHFYQDRWYYLLTFIVFGIVMGIAHILLMGKLFVQKNRLFALAFGWLTIASTLIIWMLIAAVFMQVTYRS